MLKNRIGIFAHKIGMKQIIEQDTLISTTVLQCYTGEILSKTYFDDMTYWSLCVGFLPETNKKRMIKPVLGLTNLLSPNMSFKIIKNFIFSNSLQINYNYLNVELFTLYSILSVQGQSIGKGFCGNIKRNNFTRGPMTHGSKHHRLQGSLGSGTTPGRVIPGKKMSGHMGNEKTTLHNLQIMHLDTINNTISVQGSTPGKTNNLLFLTTSV